jgi:hypothetical protein
MILVGVCRGSRKGSRLGTPFSGYAIHELGHLGIHDDRDGVTAQSGRWRALEGGWSC